MVSLCESSDLAFSAGVNIATLNRRKCNSCVIIHPAEVLLLDALCLAETIDVILFFPNEGFAVGLE